MKASLFANSQRPTRPPTSLNNAQDYITSSEQNFFEDSASDHRFIIQWLREPSDHESDTGQCSSKPFSNLYDHGQFPAEVLQRRHRDYQTSNHY